MQGCRKPEILAELGRETRIYSTMMPKRLAAVLAAEITANSDDIVCIYTDDAKLAEAILDLLGKRNAADKAVLVKDPTACQGMKTIFISSRVKPPGNLDYLMLVAPGVKGSKLGLTRVQVSPLGGGVYKLRIGSHTLLVREENGELCEPGDTLLYRVVETVRSAVREYGPLPLRDAVQIVSQELGLTRSEARRLLYEAISAGLVRLEAGSITL